MSDVLPSTPGSPASPTFGVSPVQPRGRRPRSVRPPWRAPRGLALAALGLALLAGCADRAGDPAETARLPRRVFDPDHHPSARTHEEVQALLGPVPALARPPLIGVVLKCFGNQYWQLLAEGMQTRAGLLGAALDIQAGASEQDPTGQARALGQLLERGCAALIVSPQTADNLDPLLARARQQGLPVVHVNEISTAGADWFVGPRQFQSGELAAQRLMARLPPAARVAVIRGPAGVYAAEQRTRGFLETAAAGGLQVCAVVHGEWDLQQSLLAAESLLRQHPDLAGFYANNDNMALGVAEAVRRSRGRGSALPVVGTDGIEPALAALPSHFLDATIDSSPAATGAIAVEVAVRLLLGQTLPQVIYSPQRLLTAGPASDGGVTP